MWWLPRNFSGYDLSLLLQLATATGTLIVLLRDQSTKVGVAVNRQKQHKSQEVSRLATEIVARWKDEVNKNKGAKKVTGSPNKSPLKSGPPTPAKKSKSPEAVTVPLEQRTWKTDKVDIKRTGNELRDRGVGLLYDGLACNSTESK